MLCLLIVKGPILEEVRDFLRLVGCYMLIEYIHSETDFFFFKVTLELDIISF